jgi:hypothetical protein
MRSISLREIERIAMGWGAASLDALAFMIENPKSSFPFGKTRLNSSSVSDFPSGNPIQKKVWGFSPVRYSIPGWGKLTQQ